MSNQNWPSSMRQLPYGSLTAQLALTGQLTSVLVSRGVLTADEAAETIQKIADMITSSLDRATSDLHSVQQRHHLRGVGWRHERRHTPHDAARQGTVPPRHRAKREYPERHFGGNGTANWRASRTASGR
jgi:hypothetical protein